MAVGLNDEFGEELNTQDLIRCQQKLGASPLVTDRLAAAMSLPSAIDLCFLSDLIFPFNGLLLVVVGLIFFGLVYPLTMFVRQEPALAMMLSLYVTLGIFLLLAARNPSANRSLIAFTAWSSFVHAMLMAGQAFANLIARGELLGVALFAVIGVTLTVLAPAKQSMQSASAVGA